MSNISPSVPSLLSNSIESEVDRTLYVGNIDEKVTEDLLYELFVQVAGPLESVCIPPSKENERKKTYAFVCYKHACSVPYTIQIMTGVQLFDKTLALQYRPQSIHARFERNSQSSLQRSFSAPGVQFHQNSPMHVTQLQAFNNSFRSVMLGSQTVRDEQRDRDYRSYDEDRRSRDNNRYRERDRSRSRENRYHRY
ncbi:DgyrCDS4451 [Dimorphilus gyrociliatus]|uniref:DgyrCDS4451 n=1 Tax=Dimorphilus gyrociliatus TaxID=2664684 RepID=A0A7I8VJA1_9ANNE|nr:DgyrCDS4451 [Dimorphilus gyrociliatus]